VPLRRTQHSTNAAHQQLILARPGGNITGYSLAGPETSTKQLSLLKELLPRLERIGALEEAGNPYFRAARGQFEQICHALGLTPVIAEVSAAAEIDGAIGQLARQRAQALMVPAYGFFIDNQLRIVESATKHGLPTMANDGSMVREAGALIAYSSTLAEQDRVCAELIDRILRGARAADLPVRQPTKFELVINLKTARALGLTIPKELLLRADEVIQ
jgi:putative ABC transport system substrate-binding protein